MEIDITDFFNNCDPHAFSASQWELGDNAGEITWANAVATVEHQEEACEELLTTHEQVDEFRRYMISCGSDREEIMANSTREMNAMLLQWICANMKEGGLDERPPNWDEYRRGGEAGRYSDIIYPSGDKIFIYIGE